MASNRPGGERWASVGEWVATRVQVWAPWLVLLALMVLIRCDPR